MQSSEIQNLLKRLSKLPGLGPRSGRRLALHLLKDKEKNLKPLIEALENSLRTIMTCEVCGNLDTKPVCHICTNPGRDANTLCVVADVDDLWALERTGSYKGLYHVLGGVLSAFQGTSPENLRFESLSDRLKQGNTHEIILALNATVEGQTTVHYIQERIEPFFEGRVTRLAHGVPLGGELDYLDDGTLNAALKARVSL